MTRSRGKFIVLEGGEGTGKSTILQWMHGKLEGHALNVITTREPGGTPLAEKVRKLLVTKNVGEDWDRLSEFLLFAACRAQHLQRVIRPALERGEWVLCDRFMDSSWVYQGHVKGVSKKLIDTVHAEVVGLTRPDLTLVFRLDPKKGLERTRWREQIEEGVEVENRFELHGLRFHESVAQGYEALLRRRDKRRVSVDASVPLEEVKRQVWDIVARRFRGLGH